MKRVEDLYNQVNQHVELDVDLDEFKTLMGDKEKRGSFYKKISPYIDLGDTSQLDSLLSEEYQTEGAVADRFVDRVKEKVVEELKFQGQGVVQSGAEFLEGLFGASEKTFKTLDNWTDYVSKKTGLEKGGLFKNISENQRYWSEYFKKKGLPEDAKGIAAVAENIYGGLGHATFDIPMIMTAGLPAFSAIHGGGEAIEHGESVMKGTGKGLAHGLLLHGVFSMFRGLPLPERSFMQSVTMGGESLAQELQLPEDERNYERVIADFAIGAGLISPQKGKSRTEIFNDFVQTYGTVDVRKLEGRIRKAAETLEARGKEKIEKVDRSIKDSDVRVTPEEMKASHKPVTIKGKIKGAYENVTERVVETRNNASKALKSVADILDVEYRWSRMDAPQTGFAVKNLYSIRAMHEEFGLAFAKKMAKRLEFDKETLADVVLAAENPAIKKSLSKEIIEKIGRNDDLLNEYFEMYRKEYAKRGKDINFKERILNDIDNKIELIEGEKLGESGKAAGELEGQLSDLKSLRKKAEQMNFVHIPTALWFGETALSDPTQTRRILKVLAEKKRKTFLINDLVKDGTITKDQINAVDIIASYSRRAGKDLAILDVIKAGEAEGLVSSHKKGGLYEVPGYVAPALKGKHVHPLIADWAYENYRAESPSRLYNVMSGVMSTVKMGQFYNPLFLPMYDVVQGAMLGSTRTPVRAAKNIYKGVKDAFTRSPQYWEAVENGLASQPYAPPFDTWKASFEAAKRTKGQNIMNFLSMTTPKKAFQNIYGLSHNLAWQLDRSIRMGSYNYLKEKGFSSREAAQTAARFHGDYASVPHKTRKALNLIFFTPTFKIAMGKLYGGMMKSALEQAKTMGRVDPLTNTYATGIYAAVALNFAVDGLMRNYGFDVDEWGRKYSKSVDTDEGPREIVMTFSNPANMFHKYINRGVQAFTDSDITPSMNDFLGANKWELHPVYSIASNMANNKASDGDFIYHPFEKSITTKSLKLAAYAMREAFPLLTLLKEDERTAHANDVVADEFGKLFDVAMRPFTFRYERSPKAIRAKRNLDEIKKTFMNLVKDGDVQKGHIESYIEKIERSIEDFSE